MIFIEQLNKFNLLDHGFYEAWNAGLLTRKDLQEYVCQYYSHVRDFPRYLSSIHTNCDDIATRKVVLGNLIDEEDGKDGTEDHPELWLRFADGLGLDRNVVKNAKLAESTKKLTNNFFKFSKSSTAEGIGALFAYERQVPEIARTKLATLKELYNMNDDSHLKFFPVHIGADEWHSEECEKLMTNMNSEDKVKAENAALTIAKNLWELLDYMESARNSKEYLNV